MLRSLVGSEMCIRDSPEFVQREFDEKKIFYKSCRILEGKSEKIKIKKGYAFLKKELGEEGVVQRAAKEIINSII